mmetsp:Transcript_14344/g.24643  ORF Transcript_14344/g.24643 Transcript_14344/m.24643 type:complete len:256 (+) Transcript_14344:612-1379(+)
MQQGIKGLQTRRTHCSIMQRRLARHFGLLIHIHMVLDQRVDRKHMILACGVHQGRLSMPVDMMNVCTLINKLLDQVRIINIARHQQAQRGLLDAWILIVHELFPGLGDNALDNIIMRLLHCMVQHGLARMCRNVHVCPQINQQLHGIDIVMVGSNPQRCGARRVSNINQCSMVCQQGHCGVVAISSGVHHTSPSVLILLIQIIGMNSLEQHRQDVQIGHLSSGVHERVLARSVLEPNQRMALISQIRNILLQDGG